MRTPSTSARKPARVKRDANALEDDDATPASAATSASARKPQAAKSATKKRASTAQPVHTPTVAATTEEDDDGEDEPALFHASTVIHAAAAAPAVAAQAASHEQNGMNGHDAHNNDDSDDITTVSFLSNLLTTQTPELLRILTDLQTKVKDLRRTALRPLLKEVREGTLPTSEGMSFLELKSHLMLQYLQHLVLFILTKLGGRSDANPERLGAITRQLVYLRTVMEKLKPIDKKLKYQVEKMIKLANHMNRASVEESAASAAAAKPRASASATVDEDGNVYEEDGDIDMDDPMALMAQMPSVSGSGADPLSFRPDPAALLATTEDATRANAEDGAGVGLYRAPRITSMQIDGHERTVERRRKEEARRAERVKASAYMQHMRTELSERPEERRIEMDDDRPDREQMERTEHEERNFLRLTDTRKDKARKKAKERAAKNSLAGLADGDEADDFRDIERVVGGGGRRGGFEDEFSMSADRRDELQREAESGGRKRGRGDDFDAFPDPLESRHAKKRMGPNGKTPFKAQFKKKGGGGGGRGGKRR